MNHEPESPEFQETTPSSVEVANQERVATANQASIIDAAASQDEASKIGNEEISARLTPIETTLSDLKQMFEQRLRYDDEVKKEAFDALYAQMKQHESGFQASLKENMILSLLLLHDNMVKTEADLKQANEAAYQRVAILRQELLNILYSENVEPIGELEKFDRSRQKALRTIPTDDQTQHDSVEQIVREGFIFQEKVLRPQSVVIRRYEEPNRDDQQT